MNRNARRGTAEPSEHVVDRVGEYCAHRLDDESTARIEAHLGSCAECAADFRAAVELRCAALRSLEAHPTAERLVELAASRSDTSTAAVEAAPLVGAESPRGEAALTEAETVHLHRCHACREDQAFLGTLPPFSALDSEAASSVDRAGRGISTDRDASATRDLRSFPRHRAWFTRGWLGGAALAAAALIAILIWPEPARDLELSGLARLDPIPVHISRAVAEDELEDLRLRGLEAYAEGRYVEAASRFDEAHTRMPENAEILIFLGSSQALSAPTDPEALETARETLREALDRSERLEERREAQWQLAQIELASGKPDAALVLLHVLAESDALRAGAARDLLEKIDSMRAGD